MILTVSGLPGAGTSSLGRTVAEVLGLDHLDGGTLFRALAAERGDDVHSFSARAEREPEIDLELDARLAARGAQGGVVLESRLAGWIVTNEGLVAHRVWVACEEGERARRVATRERSSVEEALGQNRRREASEADRYRRYYGIDIADLSPYDLILDSTSSGVEALVRTILDHLGGAPAGG